MPRLFLSKWDLNKSAIKDSLNVGQVKGRPFDFESWLKFLQKVGAGKSAIESAEILATQESMAVVSGQQIGIGISPIFSLAKIFAIETICKNLASDSNVTLRPVFWLQTEDHDLAEISTVNILDSNFVPQLTDFKNYILRNNGKKEERTSVGALLVGDLSLEFENKFKSILKTEDGQLLLTKFKQAYSEGKTLSESFATLYYLLFPDSEVCLFDIRQGDLNELKIPILEKALADSDKIEKILVQQNEELKAQGFEPQVKIRESSPLFFYHPDGPTSSRYRLELKGQNLRITELEKDFPVEKLTAEIKTSPENFSCSALLRPILQDSIFNTLLYVGGPAEISYLRQIKNLYPEFGIKEPLRVLRPSIIILDDKSAKHVLELELDSDLLFSGAKNLKNSVLDARIAPEMRATSILKKLKDEQISKISQVLEKAQSLDATLAKPKEKTLRSIEESLTKFFEKYEAALLSSNKVISNRLDRILLQCYPSGQDQERFVSALSLSVAYGERVFKELRDQFQNLLNERKRDYGNKNVI